jgi:predicted MFS family arabinose efflux permease
MIGAVAGGWLAQHVGWRMAFVVVGAPGVILALLIKLFVAEPPRGHSDAAEAPTPADPRGWMRTELAELAGVTRTLFGGWPMLNMMLGVTLISFAGYGIGQFSAPYFIRAFGLDYATVGLIFGLIGGFSAGLGTLAGGFVSDLAARRGARWYALIPAIGMAIAVPFYVVGYQMLDWRAAAAILLIPGVFHYTYLAPTFGVVQNVVETRRRATAVAVMFLFLNIIGLGGGPLFVGWLIDALAQFDFSHPGGHHLLTTLAGLPGQSPVHGAGFATQCPGGKAPAGAALALAGQCKAALIDATRQGILVTLAFYAWGAVHYLLASFGLARRLAQASAERLSRAAAAV